jgi:hypothetical protein
MQALCRSSAKTDTNSKIVFCKRAVLKAKISQGKQWQVRVYELQVSLLKLKIYRPSFLPLLWKQAHHDS